MDEQHSISFNRSQTFYKISKDLKAWISAQDAAMYLDLTMAQIYYAVNSGNIRYSKFPNRRIMFKKAWLDDFKSGKPFGFWAKLIRMFQ